MSDIFKITQVTEGDLRGKKIAELSDRPNQPSGFSQGLTAQELKDRFDAFPDVVKDKINEIIEMLSSEDATEYFSIESPIYKTLREFLSLFGEKSGAENLNIVDFIYARYALENETSKGWHSLRQIFDQIKADIAELKAGVQPPDDGEGDGGETPPTPPDDGGDDGGETPPTPPEGGDDGGGTTPPEGGDDGEDTPTGEYVEKYFTGASLDVPSDVAETARIVSVGSRALVSRNIYPSNASQALNKATSFSQNFMPCTGVTYDVFFELETYNDKLSVTIDLLGNKISGGATSVKFNLAVLDSSNIKKKALVTVPSGYKNLYFRYTASDFSGWYIKAPIVVPSGEAPMEKGIYNATMIQGYQGVTTFNVTNDAIKEKCPFWGYGYSDYLNTIDFENGEYVQMVAPIEEIDDWEMESTNVFKKAIEGIEAAEGADAIYCNILGSSENVLNEDLMNAISVTMENGTAVVRAKTVQATADAFVTWATTNKLFYMIRLKEPIRYSITEIASMDTIIEATPGTAIRLLDEAQQNYHKTTVRFLKT